MTSMTREDDDLIEVGIGLAVVRQESDAHL
jgi:hypothetical protein